MARQLHKLTALRVSKARRIGRYGDGGGLYLDIAAGGRRRWIFRYRERRTGKLRDMGLGSAATVSLADARSKASAARALLAEGKDPIDDATRPEREVPTFGAFSADLIAGLETGWKNEKHRAQWRSTISHYCKPIANKPIDRITTEDVLHVLQPIWTTKAETAARLRGRIEKILDAAKAKGHRSGENPARWRGHLDNLLHRRLKLQRGHHPAMPWDQLPKFIIDLRERAAIAAMALEFTILTAARTGEAIGARWSEIDLRSRVWTVPAERMKANREHRVPLCDRACALLETLMQARQGDFVFPGMRSGRPLSGMAMTMALRRMGLGEYSVHGFRASFKSWAADATSFPNELSEAALAHVVGDRVERAYRRTDALERRREMMQGWSKFLSGATASSVTSFRRSG